MFLLTLMHREKEGERKGVGEGWGGKKEGRTETDRLILP